VESDFYDLIVKKREGNIMLKKYCNNGKLLKGAVFVLLTMAGTFLAVYSNPDFIFNKHCR